MAQVALWDFDETGGDRAADGATGDGAATDAVLHNGATTSDGRLVLQGGQYAEVPADDGFQLSTGTLKLTFTQSTHNGTSPDTVVSRDAGGAEGGGHFDLSVTVDGMVMVRHQTDGDTHYFATEPGFFTPGETVQVTYSWDQGGEGGSFTVENLDSGALHSEPVPPTLSFDMGEGHDEPFTFGASRSHSADGTADSLARFFDGAIDKIALYDTVEPPGPVETPDTEETDIMETEHDPDSIAPVSAHAEAGTVDGTSGDDTMQPGFTDADGDQIGGADDAIAAGSGNDTVDGGAGNDTIAGEAGDDSLSGGAGDDVIQGDGGPETEVRDLIVNGSFEDTSGLHGTGYGFTGIGSMNGWTTAVPTGNEAGIDIHNDGRGGLDAPDGDNWADLAASPGDIRLGQDVSGVIEGETYTLTFQAGDMTGGANTFQLIWNGEVIEIDGSTVIDPPNGEFATYTVTLTGGSGDGSNRLEFQGLGPADNFGVAIDAVSLTGPTPTGAEAAGDDVIAGGAGADHMTGQGGDDRFVLENGFGDDTIVGGETDETGGDQIDATGMTDAVTVTFSGDEAGTVASGGDTAQFSEIERIDLGAGNDTVDGTASAGGIDVDGGAGDDFLRGGAGGDTLSGGSGDDVIVAGAGEDDIDLGEGDDVAYAGPGDTVSGGDGYDTLVLNGGAPVDQVVITGRTLNPDGTESQDGYITYSDGSPPTHFTGIETVVPCFTAGTLIDTARGPVPVEALVPGDLVLTRDNGYRPLCWIGSKALDAARLAAEPALRPVRIAAGALGGGLPLRDMEVSPQHRMLFSGARAEMLFGHHEVLVAAVHLVGQPGITRRASGGVCYVHILFDRHEVVRGDGAWSESFQPGDRTLAGLDAPQRRELLRLFPELALPEGRGAFTAARATLRRHEARVLLAA